MHSVVSSARQLTGQAVPLLAQQRRARAKARKRVRFLFADLLACGINTRLHAVADVCEADSKAGEAELMCCWFSTDVYTPTVNLPITDFNIRAMAKEKEPEIQSFWESTDVYSNLLSKSSKPYTLHDGPPYANGSLHIGHALNKIIKDIIIRRKLLEGYKAKFVPGWDTHGLPIELKVNFSCTIWICSNIVNFISIHLPASSTLFISKQKRGSAASAHPPSHVFDSSHL
jgi:hypothetical protein